METLLNNRIIPVKGGYNFRDLGSLLTKDGKKIKKDLLIRTDELCNLTSDDLNLLSEINIKTIVDFRTDLEREHSVDKVPSTCKNQIHLDIVAANMNVFIDEMKKGGSDFKGLLINFYKELVLSDNAIKEYTVFFKIIQNPENAGIIYHCTAGKDRTGVATALILKTLNVDWNIIEADYLLSNRFLEKKYQNYINQNPALADLFLVNSEYLKTAFNSINEKYKSVDNYLSEVLKVDLDLMKKIYTE